MAAEIILGGGGARGSYRGEPLAVAGDNRIVGVEPRDQGAGDVGGAAALAQAEERPRSLAVALDQSGFGQEPQMTGKARLRLTQDCGQVGDRQLGFRDQHEEPQPRGFAGSLERRGQGGKG